MGASPASSPRGSEHLVSLGGGRALAAAGVVALRSRSPLFSCLHCARLCRAGSAVWRQPPTGGGAGVGGTVGEGLGTGVECHPSCCPFSFGQCCETLPEAAPAAPSSRVVERSQGAVVLVRGIAKPLARFAVAKFRLWPCCAGAAAPRSPALPRGRQPCGGRGSNPRRPRHRC